MKNYILSSLLLIIVVGLFSFSNKPDTTVSTKEVYFKMPEGISQNDYVPNTIIFKLKESIRNGSGNDFIGSPVVNYALSQLSSERVAKVFPGKEKPESDFSIHGEKLADLSLIYIVKYNSPVALENAINDLYATGEVEYAQPYYIQNLDFTPNDPSLGSQYFITKVACQQGWDIQQGDTNVYIGIVDSGSDLDHPDLSANIKKNYADPIDGVDNDNNGYVDDLNGWDFGGADYNNIVGDNNPNCLGSNTNHGSHVSGDASAVTNNGVGVAGPGFKCKLLIVKTSADNDTRGPGGTAYILKGYEGIVYAADRGCAVINNSWGGSFASSFEQDAVTYATINKNALVVCAAGNDNSSAPHYPSALKYVISVASTNSTDTRSSFSNYGTTIDVSAPGSSIYSTLYNNGYATFDGTSMASPIAAGVAAIIKSQFPSYTALQVGEKLRVTCDNINGTNPSYADMLGKGRVNMFRALTVNSPSIRITDYTVSDGNNNVPQPNDTLRITGTFRNYLDAAANVSVTVSTTSTAVTILSNTATLGAMATMGTANNNSSPLRIRVNSNAPANSNVVLKLVYADGAYSDFEYISVIVNPSYFTMNGNKIATTINSRGNFTYNNYPTNTQGIGFTYNNGSNLNFEGGLIMATANNKVSDVVRGADPNTQNSDLTSVIPFTITTPGTVSVQDGSAQYNDNGAGGNKIGVTVDFRSYAFNTPADDDYIIFKYKITNTNASAISNFYIGIYSDWDVGTNGDLNKADYDAVNQLGYIWRTDNNPNSYVGMSLLTGTNVNYWAIDNDNAVAGNPWGVYDNFTDIEKWQALSSNIGRQTAGGTGTGRDVSHVLGAGPFSIPANSSIYVGFALVAAENLNDLKTNAANAKIKYASVLGISSNENLIPEKFQLHQNYPNPFNPSTTIKFGLAQNSFVKISVYDMLGREVAQLVNQRLNAGTHEASFNASNLTSGTYFYKLETEYFTETKKMLLIK
ncbi:MAG TPA: S8/S53 family peptidase [Ignavibacteria bacterium]|nr:S8/S53 family peptidase [Ignavibacteria bacterium]